jgi:hypothetical protein
MQKISAVIIILNEDKHQLLSAIVATVSQLLPGSIISNIILILRFSRQC